MMISMRRRPWNLELLPNVALPSGSLLLVLLAAQTVSAQVFLVEPRTGETIAELPHPDPVQALASLDGKTLVTASFDKGQNGTLIRTYNGPNWHADAEYLIDGRVISFGALTPQTIVALFSEPRAVRSFERGEVIAHYPNDGRGDIVALEVDDGQLFALLRAGNVITLIAWDVTLRKRFNTIGKFELPERTRVVALSRGRVIVSQQIGRSESVRYVDLLGGADLITIAEASNVVAAAFSPEAGLIAIASAGASGGVRVYLADERKLVSQPNIAFPTAIVFVGNQLAVAGRAKAPAMPRERSPIVLEARRRARLRAKLDSLRTADGPAAKLAAVKALPISNDDDTVEALSSIVRDPEASPRLRQVSMEKLTTRNAPEVFECTDALLDEGADKRVIELGINKALMADRRENGANASDRLVNLLRKGSRHAQPEVAVVALTSLIEANADAGKEAFEGRLAVAKAAGDTKLQKQLLLVAGMSSQADQYIETLAKYAGSDNEGLAAVAVEQLGPHPGQQQLLRDFVMDVQKPLSVREACIKGLASAALKNSEFIEFAKEKLADDSWPSELTPLLVNEVNTTLSYGTSPGLNREQAKREILERLQNITPASKELSAAINKFEDIKFPARTAAGE